MLEVFYGDYEGGHGGDDDNGGNILWCSMVMLKVQDCGGDVWCSIMTFYGDSNGNDGENLYTVVVLGIIIWWLCIIMLYNYCNSGDADGAQW